MGAESLGRLWGREEPSMKEGAKCSGSQRGFNMPGHGAGLLGNAESSSAISSCRSPNHPGMGRRLVECYCLGSLSENLRAALMTALTAGEGALVAFGRRRL